MCCEIAEHDDIVLLIVLCHRHTHTLYTWPSTGRIALHAHRSISTLQASEEESPVLVVTCSTQHFCGRPGCLLQVSNCPEPCHDMTERCRAWWAGAAWSIRLTWPKRECLLWLIASFMDGSCERVATSTFVTNSYQRMPSIRFWFVIWKASSFAISASNSIHVSKAYNSDNRTHEL